MSRYSEELRNDAQGWVEERVAPQLELGHLLQSLGDTTAVVRQLVAIEKAVKRYGHTHGLVGAYCKASDGVTGEQLTAAVVELYRRGDHDGIETVVVHQNYEEKVPYWATPEAAEEELYADYNSWLEEGGGGWFF